jgi:radial spoke head protein 1
VYPDASHYVGEFVGSKRQGQGSYTFANGDVYEGAWDADVKHGAGLYTFKASSSKVYSYRGVYSMWQKRGTWVEGVLKGEGEIIHADHKIKGKFLDSEVMDTPVQVTFNATGAGYSKILTSDPVEPSA